MDKKLIQAARDACNQAIAPYSQFSVGAAILANESKIITGCNIESSSYGLTICAERVALYKALSEGLRQFQKIAIYTENEEYCPPCGACRQVLWDFAPGIEVILATNRGRPKRFQLAALYPEAFENRFLRKRR